MVCKDRLGAAAAAAVLLGTSGTSSRAAADRP